MSKIFFNIFLFSRDFSEFFAIVCLMQTIQSIITGTIQSLYTIDFSPEISPAPKPELGEYCINIFPIVKSVGKAPNIISQEVADALKKHTDFFVDTNATGGYVNFFLKHTFWQRMFSDILKEKSHQPKNETIVVDYIGMNVGKPPHIGHICTPLLGQSIINALRYVGYTVIGDSHLGDWGSLFGKLIVGYKKYGNPEKLRDDAIAHLLEVYVAINADIEADESVAEEARIAFRELSNGNKEYTKMWAEFTGATIATNKKILEMMHIHQDYDIGESFYEGLDLPKMGNYPDLQYDMDSVVEELLAKWIATQNEDGSVGVVFPEETKMPSTILRKKDGTNLYLTSDLAAIKYRLTNGWNPVKILYFVDVRQSLHLKQAFWIATKMWWEGTEFFHASNGAIVLPEGAMSTRKGNIIRLDSLVEGGFDRVKKLLEEKWRTGDNSLSDRDITEITIGAIKYSYLSQDRERDVVFSWDKALNFEGNSWPYIQYAYVRAKKIVENTPESIYTEGTPELPLSPYDISLIQKLQEFEKKVSDMLSRYKPHIIAGYAYELAVAFNSFYVHTPKILEETHTDLKNFRLALVSKTANTLKKSFELLGIEMPSEM